MILSKEEFYKFYVDVNDAEVFSEYCKIANQLGVTFYNEEPAELAAIKGYRFISSDIPVQKGNLFWCDEIGMKDRHGKVKAKLSDLKPRTKVEYEKVTESIFDLKDEFDRGELYYHQCGEYLPYKLEAEFARGFMHNRIYRKVERPVEWWEDAADYLNSKGGFDASGNDSEGLWIRLKNNVTGVAMSREEWCDFARILLEQEGE